MLMETAATALSALFCIWARPNRSCPIQPGCECGQSLGLVHKLWISPRRRGPAIALGRHGSPAVFPRRKPCDHPFARLDRQLGGPHRSPAGTDPHAIGDFDDLVHVVVGL